MAITLQGARLVDAEGERIGSITFGEQIHDGAAHGDGPGIDAAGMIVTPGFIDVHTHGGGGFSLHTSDPEQIGGYARWAPSTGTTAFLAGVVGVPDGLPLEQIQAVVDAQASQDDGAEVLGIHLEGPYMSVARRGAHDPAWLRMPNDGEIEQILALAGPSLRLITVAPELPHAEHAIRRLVAAGVTVSIGHTDATYEQAQTALRWGATHMTHCCNAMRSLHHRAPGPLGLLAEAPTLRGEIIADGVHVHPAMVRLLVRALGPERTVLITDALAGAGMDDAEFVGIGGTVAHTEGGVARLPDGTITGSVLTTAQALRNTVQWTGVPLHHAVGMLTRNPAQAIKVADRKGMLQPGYDADLLIFDDDLVLHATICRGRVAWAAPAWLGRLADVAA